MNTPQRIAIGISLALNGIILIAVIVAIFSGTLLRRVSSLDGNFVQSIMQSSPLEKCFKDFKCASQFQLPYLNQLISSLQTYSGDAFACKVGYHVFLFPEAQRDGECVKVDKKNTFSVFNVATVEGDKAVPLFSGETDRAADEPASIPTYVVPADWKEARSAKLGFRIMLPSGWEGKDADEAFVIRSEDMRKGEEENKKECAVPDSKKCHTEFPFFNIQITNEGLPLPTDIVESKTVLTDKRLFVEYSELGSATAGLHFVTIEQGKTLNAEIIDEAKHDQALMILNTLTAEGEK